MSSEQQLQELSQQLQILEEQLGALQAEVQSLRAQKTSVDDATEAIETLESGSTVQVPIGGGAYVRASVEDIDEIVVGIGAGYAAEQSQEDAVAVLEERKNLIDERIESVTNAIKELEAQGEQLGQQAQEQLQHLQQQRGQVSFPPGGSPGAQNE